MANELRDELAMRFAAALATSGMSGEVLAKRAYDLAEAMLAERGRRQDSAEREAIQDEPPLTGRVWQALAQPENSRQHHEREELFEPDGLLDEPMPPSEEREYEPDIPPLWDVEPKWRPDEIPSERSQESERPGLARTRPGAAADDKRDKTGTGSG